MSLVYHNIKAVAQWTTCIIAIILRCQKLDIDRKYAIFGVGIFPYLNPSFKEVDMSNDQKRGKKESREHKEYEKERERLVEKMVPGDRSLFDVMMREQEEEAYKHGDGIP